LEAGTGHRAILNLLAQYDQRPIPIPDLLVACAASQKCGFTQLFHATYRLLAADEVYTRLSGADRLQVEMLRLKMFSQLGNFASARQQFELIRRLTHGTSLLREIGQQGAYFRRLALFLTLDGQSEAATDIFNLAEKDAIDRKSGYHVQSCRLFRMIGRLLENDGARRSILSDIAAELSDIRSEFNKLKPLEVRWTQTHAEKCAIATLYLDGAFHLKFGGRPDVDRGLKALYLAQLQNLKSGGNERSETYGEILWASNERWIESIIALSMRRDPNLLHRFEAFIRGKAAWMSRLSQAGLALSNLPAEEREQAVVSILDS
jgi:hypothetical protein